MPAEVLRVLTDVYASGCANPASGHQAGRLAARILKDSKESLALGFGCKAEQITLTSGATEAVNWAVWGCAQRPARILTTALEHAASRMAFDILEKRGCQIVRLPPGPSQTVDLQALADALRQPADLLSMILVNNETGAVQPWRQVIELRDRLQPRLTIHFDAAQAFGRLNESFTTSGADWISGSGHKIGAPVGIGWLVSRSHRLPQPLIVGGGQQGGRRAGTENAALAAALAKAWELRKACLTDHNDRALRLKATLLEELDRLGVPWTLLAPPNAVPHILTIAFPGLRGETLARALDSDGICVGVGSACGSSHRASSGTVNPVLLAAGWPRQTVSEAIRVSSGPASTTDEMKFTAQQIAAAWRRLSDRAPRQGRKP